jgi:hypothetical protein
MVDMVSHCLLQISLLPLIVNGSIVNHWLLCEVTDCYGKSLIAKESHWLLLKCMVAIESHI